LNQPRWSPSRLSTLVGVILVAAALYFAKEVLVPCAIAFLLAFLLGPLVTKLQRLGLPRVPSVVSVMLFSLLIAASVGRVVIGEVDHVLDSLPAYRDNLQGKVATVRSAIGAPLEKATRTVEDLASRPDTRGEPPTVKVSQEPGAGWQAVLKPLGKIASLLGTIGIVVLLAAVMLIQKEDMRDRLIRLAGGDLFVTTRALDDASARVSKYLMLTTLVNATLGVIVGVGLFLIGVPNALLWGLLFAILRFIPYVGPIAGAALPITLAFAVSSEWTMPLLAGGLILIVEIVTANIIEPWLYGTRTGVSAGALIIAAIFWTWIWGIPGLFLATPMTVCLAVLGKHVPPMRFLHVMLGDEPPLSDSARLYQRLLARDQDEAWEIVASKLRERETLEVFDEILIPALGLAGRDRHQGTLDRDTFDMVAQGMNDIVEDAGDIRARKKAPAAGAAERGSPEEPGSPEDPGEPEEPAPTIPALCLGAEDEADRVLATMAAQLLRRIGFAAEVVPATTLRGELVGLVRERGARLVVLSNLPPSGYVQVRYVCKRLAEISDEVPVLVGIWGSEADAKRAEDRVPEAGGFKVVRSLAELLAQARERIAAVKIEQTPDSPPADVERSTHARLHTPRAPV
jgi:predicted PurR-regulated permease PerM